MWPNLVTHLSLAATYTLQVRRVKILAPPHRSKRSRKLPVTFLRTAGSARGRCDRLDSMGKAVKVQELCTADHGVPQNQKRMFLVAIRFDLLRSSIDAVFRHFALLCPE